MKIALDVMGGDYAPAEIVKGAMEAVKEYGIESILVGQQEAVRPHLVAMEGISLVHAPEVVRMDEPAAIAVRHKRDSSLAVGLQLVKEGEAAAFVSAGNTGAVMATALFILGRIPSIERPALSTIYPTIKDRCLLIDIGANVDCKPTHLVQFALMGSIYTERIFGVSNPRVALLSNGEEEGKGDQLVRETHRMLKGSDPHFIGNVEGQHIPLGMADVVVSDGFTGNIVLKLSEGLAEVLFDLIREELSKSIISRLAALILLPAFKRLKQRLDYAEYGGAPLLGVNGTVIIAHGRSRAKAIKNALRLARQTAEQNIIEAIARGARQSSPITG
ncbi:MAG: phosphate acyltransferase PlsX [Chloroflexi bacterium]|nr:phosphate acyltransferase PlsX [Chloroflexota bacterium]MCL5074853.1 phosphate acyltransferase PlsX [Chloroflexota bacterium]